MSTYDLHAQILQEVKENIKQYKGADRDQYIGELLGGSDAATKEEMLAHFLNASSRFQTDSVAVDFDFDIDDDFCLENEETETEPASMLWLISFTDIMALMLTFFVLLYSMSSTKKDQWDEMVRSFSREVTPHSTLSANLASFDFVSINKQDKRRGLNLHYLGALIEQQIIDHDDLSEVYLFESSSRVIISLPSQYVFDDGQAILNGSGQKIMVRLSDVFSRISNRIEVAAYNVEQGRDDVWQRSLRRAFSVSKFLRQAGYERDITIHAALDPNYAILGLADDAEAIKSAMVKRVDIVVMRDNGKDNLFMAAPAN